MKKYGKEVEMLKRGIVIGEAQAPLEVEDRRQGVVKVITVIMEKPLQSLVEV